jgi:hypothetical protein
MSYARWLRRGGVTGGFLAMALAGCGSSGGDADARAPVETSPDAADAAGDGERDAGDAAREAGAADAADGAANADARDAGPGDARADRDPSLLDVGTHCAGCTRSVIGHPIWEPASALVLVGTVGSPTAGTTALNTWLGTLSGPNHRYYTRENVIGPSLPHAPPYDDEPFAWATAAGMTPTQALTAAQYTAPSGVVIIVDFVPAAGAPMGVSPDSPTGTIVPDTIFPIMVSGSILREGAPVDVFDPIFIPGYFQFVPVITADGASHFFITFADNDAFEPGVQPDGSYDLIFDVIDTDGTGDGWRISIPYSVAP